MARKVEQELKELGSKLERPPAAKDAVIKLLKLAAAYLAELDQSPPHSMMDAMKPLSNALIKPELLKHQDWEVKLFVAACLCEITRITAPEAPYEDNALKDIFHLIVSTLNGLHDMKSTSFRRRVIILETMATYRSCVVMLDLELDDLITEMLNTLFAVVSDEHPENVLISMQKIIELLFEESEDVPENLLLILLSILGRDKGEVTMAAKRLAKNVITSCAAKLEPAITQFLVSSMSANSRPLKPEINYHCILYDIFHFAPQIFSGIVPYLTAELQSEQLDIRLKAVRLLGDIFTLPGSSISEAFKPVFSEFLKRLTDDAVEVRNFVLEYAKSCLLDNPLRAEAHEIVSAICDRLMDNDENVRKQVVSVVCDVACHTLTSIPVETLKLLSGRLRDKSLLVKRHTLERLAGIYRVSCVKQSDGSIKNDEYDWIIVKSLRCLYDIDFRSSTIEPILSQSLFPADFSVKDKVTIWVRLFSGFDKVEVKALEKILEQKQRLQQEMWRYLSLRQVAQEGDGMEIQKKVLSCFRVMSHYFSDPEKAEEDFQILEQLKDSSIWETITQLIDPNTSSDQAIGLQDDLLKVLGPKHQLYEFLKTLSLRCSYVLFDKDHVRELLMEVGVHKSYGSMEAVLTSMTILVVLARFCPLLLGGFEEDLVHLLEDDNEIIKEGVLHILAKAGGTIREKLGVSSRSLDLILERICIEGSRRQAKYAVHALASITKDDGLMSLSVLYKRLVNKLEEGSHLPAVLQSLGCIAQVAMPVFETRECEIEKFIKKNILELGPMRVEKPTDWDDRSDLCSSKLFGIKTLVKSYLPIKDAHLRSQIDDMIKILKNILLVGDVSRDTKLSLVDRAHMKLVAAKAILRLLKQWENKIPIDVLYLALRTSEDHFPEVKKLLLIKVHQYVRDRILGPKYACAFLLDISSSQLDSEETKFYLNDIIQMCRQGRGRQVSLQKDSLSPSLYPEYILPHVVHSLAHHPNFPDIDECKDAKAFEPVYRQLFLFLSILVYGDADGKSDVSISKDMESVSLLKSIFHRIRHSEDAVNTAKSKNSYALCDLCAPIIKSIAPKQDDLQDSGATVTLPSTLYKPLEKKEENDLLADGQKTWLADAGTLAHFKSLKLETSGIVQSVISEDDVMTDSETEGSEMPLRKLIKHLKAKVAKAKKEKVKNKPSLAGLATENDIGILKVVKEINSGDLDSSGKFYNGNVYARKKRTDQDIQKSTEIVSDLTGAPVSKRRRTSHGHKTPAAISSKVPKGSTSDSQKNLSDYTEKLGEKPQTGSEDQPVQEKARTGSEAEPIEEKVQTTSDDQILKEKTDEPAEFEILSSRMRKRKRSSFSSKKNGKHSEGDRLALNDSSKSKKPKKASNTDSAQPKSNSKLRSPKKQKPKSGSGLAKCTTNNNGGLASELIGCRIKVWWPLDEEFYEGVVETFDTQKRRHVILYDDGDVENLRLEREHWELLDDGPKAKESASSKGSKSKPGSSGRGKRLSRGSKENEESEKKTGRRKRTPQRSLKPEPKINKKHKSSKKTSESSDSFHSVPTAQSSQDDSDSEKDHLKDIQQTEELSSKDHKQEEGAENSSNDVGEPEDDCEDSENHDADGSDTEAVSSSEKSLPKETKEKPVQDSGKKGSHAKSSYKHGRKASASACTEELSDDKPLSTWKQRPGKK